jgi:hypothetical protein
VDLENRFGFAPAGSLAPILFFSVIVAWPVHEGPANWARKSVYMKCKVHLAAQLFTTSLQFNSTVHYLDLW